MGCLLKGHLQMKVKGLSNLDSPRTPHILLNIVFPIDVLPFFPIWKFLAPECALAKIDSLLKKLSVQTHQPCLSFYCNSQEKQFLKGILGRREFTGKFPCRIPVICTRCTKSQVGLMRF